MFLRLSRQSGHAGGDSLEILESTPSLGDCYQQLRAGTLNLATGHGQRIFGLAVMKESGAL